MSTDDDLVWSFRDESYYRFLTLKYKDRKKLSAEAEDKRKALDKMKDGDQLYHRASTSAEMAQLRVDMAYMVDRNNQLEQMLGTVEFLHQKVGILEGAYGSLKMLFETVRMQTVIRNEPRKDP